MSGKKYWGSINLNSIKDAIDGGMKTFEGKKGKYLDINVWVNEEEDSFGNKCSIQCYNKDTKQVTYLANLKESDKRQAEPAKQGTLDTPDLPF